MKNLPTCQEIMIIRQKTDQITCIIKSIKKSMTDLSRQTNLSIPQQINLTGKLEEEDGATMFLLLKSTKNYSKFFFRKFSLQQNNINNRTPKNIKFIK